MPPEPSVTSASEGAAVMDLEVIVGAVAKKLRTPRPEVGEPGDVQLGRQGGCLKKVDRGHACSLLNSMAANDNDFSLRALGVYKNKPAADAYVEDEQAADVQLAGGTR
jgi:hypothetical protein